MVMVKDLSPRLDRFSRPTMANLLPLLPIRQRPVRSSCAVVDKGTAECVCVLLHFSLFSQRGEIGFAKGDRDIRAVGPTCRLFFSNRRVDNNWTKNDRPFIGKMSVYGNCVQSVNKKRRSNRIGQYDRRENLKLDWSSTLTKVYPPR